MKGTYLLTLMVRFRKIYIYKINLLNIYQLLRPIRLRPKNIYKV